MRKNIPEKISDIETEIQQLINQKTKLLQEQKESDRKARTKRLCERGGFLESILPDTVTLTAEQFKTLLSKTLLTSFASRILAELTAENSSPVEPDSGDTVQKRGTAEAKTPSTAA